MTKYYSILFLSLLLFLFSCGEAQDASSGNNKIKKELKTEIGVIKFDESITGFKLAAMLGTKFLFSLHGQDDLNNANPTTGFYLKPLKSMDYERAKDYLKEFSFDYGKQDGILKTENTVNKVINVNNHKAFIITFTAIDNTNKKSYLTLGVLSDGNNAVLFAGNDLDNGKYSTQFLDTFKSLEL